MLAITPARLFAEDVDLAEVEPPSCDAVKEKNNAGAKLTPAEGNLLINCYSFDEDFMKKYIEENGWEGFQAYQPPPGSLMEQYQLENIPGILGGMVDG